MEIKKEERRVEKKRKERKLGLGIWIWILGKQKEWEWRWMGYWVDKRQMKSRNDKCSNYVWHEGGKGGEGEAWRWWYSAMDVCLKTVW